MLLKVDGPLEDMLCYIPRKDECCDCYEFGLVTIDDADGVDTVDGVGSYSCCPLSGAQDERFGIVVAVVVDWTVDGEFVPCHRIDCVARLYWLKCYYLRLVCAVALTLVIYSMPVRL